MGLLKMQPVLNAMKLGTINLHTSVGSFFVACFTLFICSCSESPEDGVQRVLDENTALLTEFQGSSSPGMEALTTYVSGLQQIDIKSCPPDFREVFQVHINTWIGTHKELSSQPDGFIEGAAMGVLNTFLGERDGGVSRMTSARRYWASQREASAYRVTEIAARYGAKAN